jgi:hypothetical protein
MAKVVRSIVENLDATSSLHGRDSGRHLRASAIATLAEM